MAISFATGHPAPEAIDARFGWSGATRDSLFNIVTPFSVYHSIRDGDIETSRSSIASRALRPLAHLTRAHAKAAARTFSNMLGAPVALSLPGLRVATDIERPHSVISNTDLHFDTDNSSRLSAGTLLNARFVQGGDHFTSTSFTSRSVAESSPITGPEFPEGSVAP